MSDKVHFTDEEMEDLTEAERAGLLEEMGIDDDAEDQDNEHDETEVDDQGFDQDDEDDLAQDFDNGNLADDDDHVDDDQADVADQGTGDDDADGTDTGAGDGDGDVDEEDQEEEPDYEPLISAPDIDEKLNEQYELKRQIAEKFDDGEITAREKAEQEIQIDNEIYGLRRKQDEATRAFSDAKSGWIDTHVPDFMKSHPQFKPNSRLTKLLNEEVKDLQLGQFAGNPFHPAILEKAKKNLIKEWGEDFVNAEAAKVDKRKEKLKVSKRPPMPPTLKSVPTAMAEDVLNDGGKFAALDRLAQVDTEKYEEELGKLSPEQLDQYMQSS